MGKFINVDQKVTLNTLSNNVVDLLNNPYYLHADKKGTVCQYYNINTTKTTLDQATRDNYSELGHSSPIRYNKIRDAIIYGFNRVDISLDVTEFGLEASDITGEIYVLPNTFIPYPGDFFSVDNLNKPYLFKVTNVEPNMLDTGAQMYKVTYILAYPDHNGIDNQVVAEYIYNSGMVGTNFNAVIELSMYELISKLEALTVKLKDYFYMLFYDQKVQTFIYLYNGTYRVYDPYMIEFIIRNKILKGSTNYCHVSQMMTLPSSFGVSYDKTIFSSIEQKDVSHRIKNRYVGNLIKCEQTLSLLYAHPYDYYYMEYDRYDFTAYGISIFGDIDVDFSLTNNYKTNSILFNILIKFFNNEQITDADLDAIQNGIDYCNNIDLFYGIPITIYCIERMIYDMVS